MSVKANIKGLYHFAFPCRDAEETRAFYEDLLCLPLVHCMRADTVPSSRTGEPYAHLFFEMGDGSYVAFFDLGHNQKPQPSPNTPDWVQHLALEMPDLNTLLVMKAKLEAAGVEVKGLVDHGFIKSIYFFDPNGLRLELTIRTEEPGHLEDVKREAHSALQSWCRYKAGRTTAKT